MTGIDKTSSAELSEAINSMFQWYRDSAICYAYIEDISNVPDRQEAQPSDETQPTEEQPCNNVDTESNEPSKADSENQNASHHPLGKSRWFTRGWTLQGLLAPKQLIFYDREWLRIGSKESLADVLIDITKVPVDVLLHLRQLRDCSIAKRMSWAAWRETSRIEDMSYCLMGIFDVQMPLLYGEGDNAFVRLQK